MRKINLCRIAAVLMVFYALGHTLGALLFLKSFGSPSDGVLAAMKNVTFPCNGSTCTWYGFYLGFGWFCTIFFLFTAFVAWQIGGDEPAGRSAALPICCGLFASYAAGGVLAWKYFFTMPLVFSTLISILLALHLTRVVMGRAPMLQSRS